MSTLVAIAYPDQGTSEEARETVRQLESVIKTSLSQEDTKKLQDALQPPTPATAS